MKDVIVLGAGMIGVSVGVALARRGVKVAIIDRRGPGEETSFGNAGVIEREGLEPVGFPRDIIKLGRLALNLEPEAHYHPSFLPKALPFLWRLFLAGNAAPMARYAEGSNALLAHAIRLHREWAAETGAQHFYRQTGWIRLHRSARSFGATTRLRRLADTYGLNYDVLDPVDIAALEPALKPVAHKGILWRDTDSVTSPGGIVQAFAAHFRSLGGEIIHGDARSLRREGEFWGVETPMGAIRAPRTVVALGPWAMDVLTPLGVVLPFAVKRGYHQHFAPGSGPALTRPVVDTDFGYVVTPMQRGIRLTTGLEIADRDAPSTPVQVKRLTPVARGLVDLGPEVDAEPWLGRRPVLPDSLPVIGRAVRHKGLWLAIGHGHLGFTQGPVTGTLLGQMMTGEGTIVDPAPYRAERFA